MKILVTGGAGFVGTNLIKRLLKEGHEVVSVDNYSTGKKENHQSGCTYHENDLSSDHILGIYVDHGTYPSWRDEEFDVIYHMAALARIQPSFDDPIDTFKSNVVATMNILEYSRRNGNIPVVYADSSSVHGNKYANPYTFTKYNGTELCRMYNHIYDLPTAVCRFYNVYGKHQLTEGEYCTVVGIFQRQYEAGEPLTITWDGEQRRDFTNVEDIVDGLIKSGNSLVIPNAYNANVSGKEFELGTSTNWSINELASWFGEYPTKSIPKREGEMRESLCTDTLAWELLGWKPKVTLEDYIKDFVQTQKFLNE
jgi:UDP-glucose 4-epimerase